MSAQSSAQAPLQSTIEGLWRARELPRQHVADAGTGTGFAALDEVLADRGWPQAGLVELLCEDCGIGELRLLSPALATLASTDKRCIAWINPPHLPYPPALQTAGIDPSRVLLVRVQNHRDALWAFEQACKSGACCAVLGWLEPSAGEREGACPSHERAFSRGARGACPSHGRAFSRGARGACPSHGRALSRGARGACPSQARTARGAYLSQKSTQVAIHRDQATAVRRQAGAHVGEPFSPCRRLPGGLRRGIATTAPRLARRPSQR